jgi:hypothetical protein
MVKPCAVVVGWRAGARAGATARHGAGSSTGGGTGEPSAHDSTRNRLWLLQRMHGRVARGANTSARAVLSLRELVGGAKLLGVRDWPEGRMGQASFAR